ncbi:MAG: dienelactone hydrolase family protein [Pseudomonadales bacterium]|nr:dienelactone hydrolase family protein [Pseudomonadales bacterium]
MTIQSGNTTEIKISDTFIEVLTPDGSMECFAAWPEDGGSHPPIILYMDAPGVREELYEFVRRIAKQGYFAVMPNLYYRYGIKDPGANMMEMLNVHTNPMIISDTQALISWLDANPHAKHGGPIGCIGYCMSGKFVLAVTGSFPDRFKAMVSMYGVSHVTDKPDSAHLLIPEIRSDSALHFSFAEHDPYVPDAEIEFLKQTLEENKVDFVLEKVPETGHGFAFPERMGYHHAAAERHWDIAFALFERKLK